MSDKMKWLTWLAVVLAVALMLAWATYAIVRMNDNYRAVVDHCLAQGHVPYETRQGTVCLRTLEVE